MGEWSLAGLIFAKLTVNKKKIKNKKLNHKVSRLCGEMRKGVEKYCNLPVPLQSRQTYGRMFNLLSSP